MLQYGEGIGCFSLNNKFSLMNFFIYPSIDKMIDEYSKLLKVIEDYFKVNQVTLSATDILPFTSNSIII